MLLLLLLSSEDCMVCAHSYERQSNPDAKQPLRCDA